MGLRANKSRFDLSEFEVEIMLFVTDWIKTKKTTVPSRAIVKGITEKGYKEPAILVALRRLSNKGYIRKTAGASHGFCSYQLLKSLPI